MITYSSQYAQICLAIFAVFATRADATSIVKMTFEELCGRADVVFVGTVVGSEGRRDDQSGMIHTYTTFRDVAVAAGEDGVTIGDGFVLRTLGGVVGDESLIVHGMPRFDVGRRYVVFLKAGGQRVCPVVGWGQGCFHVIDSGEPGGGSPTVRAYREAGVGREQFSGGYSTSAGTDGQSTVRLDEFVDEIRETFAREHAAGIESPPTTP